MTREEAEKELRRMNAEYMRKWRKRNPDKEREYHRRSRERKIEELMKRAKETEA